MSVWEYERETDIEQERAESVNGLNEVEKGKVISTFLFQINEKENPSGDHKGGENLAHGEWA
jgi:hypothetical protein